MAMLPK